MTAAIMECLNPDCWCPGGQADLPERIDPDQTYDTAQCDWPICDACLEPLSLSEIVKIDDALLVSWAEECHQMYDVQGLRRLRALCARRIIQDRLRQ